MFELYRPVNGKVLGLNQGEFHEFMSFHSLNDQQELAFVSYSFWEDLYSLVNKMRNF